MVNSLEKQCGFRWKVEVTATKHLGLRIPNKTLYMYNYLSVGVDAQVALDFHRTRESMSFGNRVFNKVPHLFKKIPQNTMI